MNPTALGAALVAVGAGLVMLDIAGLLVRPYAGQRATSRADGTPEPPLPALSSLRRIATEDDATFLRRLVATVHGAIIHFTGAHNDRVSPLDNWFLWSLGLAPLTAFRRYHFVAPRRAFWRGYGLCSQAALTLSRLLRAEGIDARVAGFPGHVVTLVKLDGNEWILADPDYDIVVPRPIDDIRLDPTIIDSYYAPRYATSPIARLKQIYAGKMELHDPRRIAMRLAFENGAYAAKWVLPGILLAIGLWLLRTS